MLIPHFATGTEVQYFGVVDPPPSLGVSDEYGSDYYINTSTYDVWRKDGSAWVWRQNIAPDTTLDDPRYLLPAKIRLLPLHDRVSTLLKYVQVANHYDINKFVANKYQYGQDGYSPLDMIHELGGQDLIPFLGSEQDAANTVRLLSRIQAVKGLDLGMELLLSIIGLEGRVYDWFTVKREIDNWTEQGQEWANDPTMTGLKNCEFLIDLVVKPGDGVGLEFEERVYSLARLLMWSCAKLAVIRITFGDEDSYTFLPEPEQTSITITHDLGEKYGNPGSCIYVGQHGITVNDGSLVCEHIDPTCLIIGEFDIGISIPICPSEGQLNCYKIGSAYDHVLPTFTIGSDTEITQFQVLTTDPTPEPEPELEMPPIYFVSNVEV